MTAPVAIDAVDADWQPDDGGVAYRLGLIELATAETAERDFRVMLPREAQFYTTRVLNENPVTLDNLRQQQSRLALAVEQLLPGAPLDAVAYDCTSGTVAMGYDAIAAAVHKVRPDVPVITPITAAIAAFRALGVRRVSVLTPYTDDVNHGVWGYLVERGITVDGFAAFGIENDLLMARLPPSVIARAAIETTEATAEALFISCTAIRAVEVIRDIEGAIGRPVVTSIQATCWQLLRSAGYRAPIIGFGRLLEDC
jgi:maleate isomerase